MVLAMERVDGRLLDELDASEIDAELLDAIWEEVALLHRARFAHRVLRAGNIMVAGRQPRLIDMDFAKESASPRLQAIDRAELLASLAAIVGVDAAVASAARVLDARRPGRGRAVPAAARAVGRDAQAGVEGDARRTAIAHRRGHRRGTAARWSA